MLKILDLGLVERMDLLGIFRPSSHPERSRTSLAGTEVDTTTMEHVDQTEPREAGVIQHRQWPQPGTSERRNAAGTKQGQQTLLIQGAPMPRRRTSVWWS